MILYYANGGGLGHLKRTSAVIHTLKLPSKKIILLTASSYHSDNYLPNFYDIIPIPHKYANDLQSYRFWLKEIIIKYTITDIFLDVFPVGLVGEWQNLESWLPLPYPSFHLIARLLNWENYQRLIVTKPPIFHKIYAVESLNFALKNYLLQYNQTIENLNLIYPKTEFNNPEKEIYQELENYGLVIHSEPMNELKILIDNAKDTIDLLKIDLQLVIISKVRIKHTKHKFVYTNHPEKYIEKAKLVFTGGGFNSIDLAKKYPKKHFITPFQRFYDLQFVRVANWRKQNKNINQSPQ